MSACLFCDIAQGHAPAHLVHRTQTCRIFCDTSPIREGHVQIIPRAHFATFDDLPADLAAEIIWLGQHVARALKAQFGVPRVGFVFSGNDVAHVHAHVLPLFDAQDITSARYFEGPLPARRSDLSQAQGDLAATALGLQYALGAVA